MRSITKKIVKYDFDTNYTSSIEQYRLHNYYILNKNLVIAVLRDFRNQVQTNVEKFDGDVNLTLKASVKREYGLESVKIDI